MSLVKPIAPMVMPSDLANVTNGAVPMSLITPCGVKSGYAPFAESAMHHLASRAMKAMMAALNADLPAHNMTNTGTGRSYAQQVQLFDGTDPATWSSNNGRYVPQSQWAHYDAQGRSWALPVDVRSWNGTLWKRRAGTAMAAVPGTSNHGWWLAIDFSEDANGNPLTGITTQVTQWLIVHAMTYGFSAEAQSEDWHWRYVAGDNLPVAVLLFEAHTPPTPVYDDDMPTLYRDSRFWNVFLVNGDVTTIGPALNDSLIARGVPQVVDTHDQSLISFMRKAQIKTSQLVASSTPGPFNPPADLQG